MLGTHGDKSQNILVMIIVEQCYIVIGFIEDFGLLIKLTNHSMHNNCEI